MCLHSNAQASLADRDVQSNEMQLDRKVISNESAGNLAGIHSGSANSVVGGMGRSQPTDI